MMFETRSIGIDFKSNSVKIAVATVHGRQTRIIDLIEKQMPESTPEEVKDLSAAIIREAFVENDLNGDTCVIALPASATINRQMLSPVSDSTKIRQTLKFQMEPQIPYPVDQVVADFIPLRKTTEGTEILAIAVTKDVISERLEVLRKADIDPQIATIDFLAIADFYMNPFDFSEEKSTALLCLQYDHSFLGFFSGEKLIGYRNFEGVPLGDNPAEQRMLKEIHRSLLAYQSSGQTGGELGTICITGPNADKFKGLLQERFPELPVKVLEFNENGLVEIPPYLMASAEDCHLAIALAHVGQGAVKNPTNFRQEEYAPASLLSRVRPNIYFSIALLIIALIAWFTSIVTSNRYQARQLDSLKSETIKAFADTLPTVKSPDDVQQKIRQEQEKFKLLKAYSSDYVPPLDVLAEVTANIPQGKTVVLNDLAISDNTLRMTGEADSFDDINLFRDYLDRSPLLTEAKIESANKADKSNKITFRIKANVGQSASEETKPAGTSL